MARKFRLIKRGDNDTTLAEAQAGVVPTDLKYPIADVRRYGATGDGTTDDTNAIIRAISVIEVAGGGIVFFPRGSYKITASLIYEVADLNGAIIFRGEGSHANGSVILNETNDVEAIRIEGDAADNAQRTDRCVIEDLRIIHNAATKTAIVAIDAPYLFMNRVKVDCEGVGHSALFLGTTTTVPDSDNFLSAIRDCDFRSYDDGWGIRINSSGHTILIENCKVGGGGTGSKDCWFESEGVTVRGGQLGGGEGGVVWDNAGAGDIEYGRMQDVKIEGVESGEVGIAVVGTGGTPRSFHGLMFENLGVNMAAMDGTFVQFDRAKQCKLVHPVVRNPTSGSGKLAEWTANSDQCELVVDYEGAQAALTVNASANRASKKVTGMLSNSQVANVTVYANLRTILVDGVVELGPGHQAAHNGTAWNFQILTINDDNAASFTPPSTRTLIEVTTNGGVTFAGNAFCDTDAGGAAISAQGVGADFNVTTGVLAGTTGTDVKLTVSTHTDGKIYIENRTGGTRKVTVRMKPVDNL